MLDNGCCGGTFRPRSEEEAWNWVVVRSSTARPPDFFWSSPFLRDTMPSRSSCYVPEGTHVKKLCKLGIFPSEDVQLVIQRLCGVDGRGECKNASTCTWGTVFSPVPSEGRTAQGMDCEEFVGKIPPLTQNTCVCGAHFDGGKRQDIFPFLQDLCGLSLRKKLRAVESRPPGCKVPGRSRDGGWWEHQQGSWQTPNLQRQLMKRKIPSLWKATFKTSSRRWKLESGSLKPALWLSVKISWRREKSCGTQHDRSVLLVQTWAIWKKN